jgi:hypothetical protein
MDFIRLIASSSEGSFRYLPACALRSSRPQLRTLKYRRRLGLEFLVLLLDGRLEVLIRRFVANVRDELLKTTLKAVLTGLHLKYINTCAIFIHRSGRATIKRINSSY